MSAPQSTEFRAVLSPGDLRYLIVHLEAEEAALAGIRRLLEQLPTRSPDPSEQRAFRLRVEELVRRNQQIGAQRTLVLTHLARLLKCDPATLSLNNILQHCSPAAVGILQPARQRMRRLLRSVQLLSSTVGWIVNESRSIHQLLIEVITGTVNSERYDASGHLNTPGVVSVGRRQ